MKRTLVLTLMAGGLMVGCGKSEPIPTPAKPTPPPTPVVKEPAPPPAPVATNPASTGDAEAGAAVYARICVACHQADGTGLNGMLAASFVDDKARLAKSDEELLTSIRNGITANGRVMPPQKDVLSDKEMHAVLAYVRKTFGD